MTAARSGSTKCLRLLLAAGANPVLVDCQGWSALHHAASYQDREENITILLKAGIGIEVLNTYGTSPLSLAAASNHSATAAVLLDYGATINHLDNDGDSALYESIHWHSNNTTQLLLSRGASYTLWFSTSDTILHSAAKYGDNRTLEIMIVAGLQRVDPYAINCEGKTALQIAQERQGTEEGFIEKFHQLLEDIRARNATLENSIPKDLNPLKSSSWLQHKWLQLISGFFKVIIARSVRNNPYAKSKISFRIYIFSVLCLIGCAWIYRAVKPELVASLLQLIWDIVGPGDWEGL